MTKRYIFDFLRDLRANNSKEWMDENRKCYHKAKDTWLEEIALLLKRLEKHDSRIAPLKPKSTISRINNNRRFHPDKPVYKTFFTFSVPQEKNVPSLHISVSPKGSFIGGGFWRPDKELLDKIRAAIDYNGEELKKIIQEEKLVNFYGGWAEDDQKLKTSPQNYDQEHPHIELLRRKNFVVVRDLTQEEIMSNNFVDLVEEAYLALEPLLHYLEKAASFEEE